MMLVKRHSPSEDLPSASSSYEPEEAESEDTEDEIQEVQTEDKVPEPKRPVEETETDDDNDEEEPEREKQEKIRPTSPSHESHSESDSSGKRAVFKPKSNGPKPKNPDPTATLKTPSKRKVKTDRNEKELKKKKRKNEDAKSEVEEEISKKTGILRLWSEDDEIAILKGLIDCKSKIGCDPSVDPAAFHDFIKKSLHIKVSTNQLKDKIRRLKKKYLNNSKKGENGEDPIFSRPHDCKSYELSKKVWDGDATVSNGVDKPKTKSKKIINSTPSLTKCPDEFDSSCVEKLLSHSVPDLGESFVKKNLTLIENPKLKKELEDRWKKLKVAEMEVFLQRVELIRDQTKLILDSIKSAES